MSNKQILYIWKKVRPFFVGVPEPDKYAKPLGDLWENIKAKSTNEAEAKEAFKMLVLFRNILDAAAREGVSL